MEIIRCPKRYVAREIYPLLLARRVTHLSGAACPISGCRNAGLRTIRRPSPGQHPTAERDLIRAFPPHLERPIPVLSAPSTQQTTEPDGRKPEPKETLTNIGASFGA